jgi:hypothetical protein
MPIVVVWCDISPSGSGTGAGDETRTRSINFGKGEDLICRVARASNRRHTTSRPTLFQSPRPKFCELSIRTAGFKVLGSLNGASSSAICCGRRATDSRVSATASRGLISFSWKSGRAFASEERSSGRATAAKRPGTGEGRLSVHCRRDLSEIRLDYNNSHYKAMGCAIEQFRTTECF